MIVLHAVMTYDRSSGTREAGSGKFCMIYGFAGRTCGAPARQSAMVLSCKFEKGGSAGQIRGWTRGSAENNSRVMTRSDPRDFETS